MDEHIKGDRPDPLSLLGETVRIAASIDGLLFELASDLNVASKEPAERALAKGHSTLVEVVRAALSAFIDREFLTEAIFNLNKTLSNIDDFFDFRDSLVHSVERVSHPVEEGDNPRSILWWPRRKIEIDASFERLELFVDEGYRLLFEFTSSRELLNRYLDRQSKIADTLALTAVRRRDTGRQGYLRFVWKSKNGVFDYVEIRQHAAVDEDLLKGADYAPKIAALLRADGYVVTSTILLDEYLESAGNQSIGSDATV